MIDFVESLQNLIKLNYNYRYPERPVIYISLCHMFMSSAVFIRLILGKEQITCRRHQDDFVFIEVT